MPPQVNQALVPAHIAHAKHPTISEARALSRRITAVTVTASGGYRFRNFDGPTRGIAAATVAGTGTNMNGIANSGTALGLVTGNSGAFINFTDDPITSRTTRILHIRGSSTAAAYGINSAGTVVGSYGNARAFALSRGGLRTFIPTGGNSATASGINDRGTIVGQYATSTATPGFISVHRKSYVTVNAPSGPNTVSVQGINNKGLTVVSMST
jgi:hypothetical protein